MILKNLREDIDNVLRLDPAARSRLEVLFCYSGLHAVWLHRLANLLWRNGFHLLGRFVSQAGRFVTGVEIHPAARIGRRLFIDHGMGVVIGETTEIGDDVTLYQQVTLGGATLNRGKRHPTLEDGVIVGAGAKILGGFTIGKNARVGANAVVIGEVKPGASVGGVPARVLGGDKTLEPIHVVTAADLAPKPEPAFVPYGTPCDETEDPVACKIDRLGADMATLRERVAELERELDQARVSAARRQA
ncbi:MAG: serine O-acetyltransferase [Stellaceae bacterium]